MNTKHVGNVAESRFIFECTRRGVDVSLPFGDNARYDAIVDFYGVLLRVQIKTLRKISEGVYDFPTRSNSVKGQARKDYVGAVDYFFAYNEEDDVFVFVPIRDVGDKYAMIVRNTAPKNGQSKGINLVGSFSNLGV